MGQIKIAFFDIDGTLIDMKRKKITEKTLEALSGLKRSGVKICVATGRSPMQVPRFPGVEFDAYLTYNGSYCYTTEEKICSNALDREEVYTIISNAEKLGRPVSLATDSRLASNGSDEDLAEYYSFAGLEVTVADDFDTVASQDEIYQIMLGCRRSDYEAILQDVRGAKIAAWWTVRWISSLRQEEKALRLRRILEYYCLTKDEAMAFGDGNNDIDMLRAVGTGVAMANGSDELKSIADDICGDVAEDGVYRYCLEHGLI